MFIASSKEFRIQQDKLLKVLRVEWTGGQNIRTFRPAFGQLLKLAGELSVRQVVLDINSLPDVPVYDQLWLSTHFMPELLRLPLTQLVVVLSSEHVYNHQVVESLFSASRLYMKFDIQLFTHIEPAMQWITDNSPHLPALLAEWALASSVAPAPRYQSR